MSRPNLSACPHPPTSRLRHGVLAHLPVGGCGPQLTQADLLGQIRPVVGQRVASGYGATADASKCSLCCLPLSMVFSFSVLLCPLFRHPLHALDDGFAHSRCYLNLRYYLVLGRKPLFGSRLFLGGPAALLVGLLLDPLAFRLPGCAVLVAVLISTCNEDATTRLSPSNGRVSGGSGDAMSPGRERPWFTSPY